MKKTLLGLIMLTGTVVASDWKTELERQLPLMGHRNWIAVVDSAYPLQTAPGIKTLHAGGGHVSVLKEVFEYISRQKHVRPSVFTDEELKFLDEEHAPGIAALREQLQSVLLHLDVQERPHEQIIAQLVEAGKTFQVLIIKTDLTLPYTSVFILLDCGYWSAGAGRTLRDEVH